MIRSRMPERSGALTGWLALAVLAAGCGDDGPVAFDGSGPVCSIPESEILVGARRDAIAALTDPPTAFPGQDGTRYLADFDRVIGLELPDGPLAIPLNILWYHEIVNLNGPEYALAVTHCPLTGSSLAFDRATVLDAEFGVSGLLYRSNLIMYDRNGATESLWPQMVRGARCGARDGTALPMVPILESTWAGWTTLHPDTRVLTSNTSFDLDYRFSPYGDYDRIDNGRLLFSIGGPVDPRRPPKERALGVTEGAGGTVYPFGELDQLGAAVAVHGHAGGADYVVFWDRARSAAMAYRPVVDGSVLEFSSRQGRIFDQAGGEWRVDGTALNGPHAGARLDPVADAFVAFWFAWPAFYPELELWSSTP